MDSSGYLQVTINGKEQLVHRIIFLLCHGYLPENDIDHIDRDKTNNKIENLREVSRSCNTINGKIRSDNTSGIKGVSFINRFGRYCASIRTNNKSKNLGYYREKIDAACARLAAEQCLGFGGCDGNSTALIYVKAELHKIQDGEVY